MSANWDHCNGCGKPTQWNDRGITYCPSCKEKKKDEQQTVG